MAVVVKSEPSVSGLHVYARSINLDDLTFNGAEAPVNENGLANHKCLCVHNSVEVASKSRANSSTATIGPSMGISNQKVTLVWPGQIGCPKS